MSDGSTLALLLLAGFRTLVDELHADLARNGHPGVRPVHGFALHAIGADGVTVSQLGHRLGVSKQAAGKTVDALERLGYAKRGPHPSDARSSHVRVTGRGEDVLRRSAASFDRLRAAWADAMGADDLAALERGLTAVVGGNAARLDVPGWLGVPRTTR